MGSAHAVEGSRSGDARLTLAVAGACVAAFGVFVVVPPSVAEFDPPPGIDAVWSVGGLLTILLGPVVAGLCGYVSAAALCRSGGALSAPVRRLDLVENVTAECTLAAWAGGQQEQGRRCG